MSININNALSLATSSTSTTQPSTPATTKATQGPDENSFLTLLVTQLKNQDPLAPQDSSQFVAQLAQFNSLDQLININKEIGQLVNKQ